MKKALSVVVLTALTACQHDQAGGEQFFELLAADPGGVTRINNTHAQIRAIMQMCPSLTYEMARAAAANANLAPAILKQCR